MEGEVRLSKCERCGRKYSNDEEASRCKEFGRLYNDWECRPSRGMDKW